jgi:proteasome assembly chaperone (PAC2) family protein
MGVLKMTNLQKILIEKLEKEFQVKIDYSKVNEKSDNEIEEYLKQIEENLFVRLLADFKKPF